MQKYVRGIFKKSIFKSETGFIIGLFKVSDTNDEEISEFINKTITFTGTFAELNEDDKCIFFGEIVKHPKYGFQYNVKESKRVKPEDKDGIIEFLSSDLFKGIGFKLATKIVETLGEKTLDLIITEPESLNLVPTLTQKKAQIIIETLNKYEESHQTIVYLTELGFTMNDALAIYNKFKSNTIHIIENNIYSILDTNLDISFLKIDEINKDLKEETSNERIKACIFYVMNTLVFKNKDTYLYYEEIKVNTLNYLKEDITDELFINYLDELRYEGKIVFDNDKYYVKNIFASENNIVDKIENLLNQTKDKYKNLEKCISDLETENDIIYNDSQKEAIISALENNIVIITGGPGTGKTTIIKAIVNTYIKINKLSEDDATREIALLAPTGRASKRMSESTLFPASTIHRFLKWNKETNEFAVNELNKDYSKLVIIDEVSMIDNNLLDNLFRGLINNIKLVLVGDYNQLPSVGIGQILKDLIESKAIKTIYLNLLYRQSNDSYIPTLACEVNNNEISDNFLESKDDYTFLKCNKESIPSNLSNLVKQIIEKGYDYKRVQLMAPMYAGVNGIDNLNKELQNIFNPAEESKREIKSGDIIFRENDKILQLTNMPEENVFNGDIGVIKYIILADTSKSKKNELYIDFDGTVVKYLPQDFYKIKHGFIISIHKSQGSEFEMVIMPISSSYSRMLYKKLIYTGITRAKKKLILIGDPNAFLKGVANNNEINRKTSLKEKLENLCIKK